MFYLFRNKITVSKNMPELPHSGANLFDLTFMNSIHNVSLVMLKKIYT